MTKNEFINQIVGTQYVNRGYSLDGCDCYGLVYLYYKFVYEWESLITKEYKDYKDFSISFTAQLQDWQEVEKPNDGDCCFVCFSHNEPIHCGVYIGKNKVLHANGDPKNNMGQVQVWSMSLMKRYLSRYYKLNQEPVIKFYRPKELTCQS